MLLAQCGKDADCTNGPNGVCGAFPSGALEQCLLAQGAKVPPGAGVAAATAFYAKA